jgi:hypothetical protein
MPQSGCATLSSKGLLQMEKSMSGQLSMFDLMTSEASPSAISSQALQDGHTPHVSPGGPMTDSYGPGRAPASRSPSPERAKARKTSGTSGPSSSASFQPVGPMSSWENRLRQRLARIGSTECSLTWKASVTPAGRQLFRLVPSMRPIAEIDCGLWRTPNHRDGKGAYTDPEAFRRRLENGRQLNLNDEVRMAMWATPMAHEARLGYQRRMGDAKGSQKSLTTEATDVLGLGENVTGSRATTEKPGALNPAFVFWLMGFPPEWESCAPPAMPSSRKSRPK